MDQYETAIVTDRKLSEAVGEGDHVTQGVGLETNCYK